MIQLSCFELILLLKLDKQFPVEQFEATVSQSTVPSPLLFLGMAAHLLRDNVGRGAGQSGAGRDIVWYVILIRAARSSPRSQLRVHACALLPPSSIV